MRMKYCFICDLKEYVLVGYISRRKFVEIGKKIFVEENRKVDEEGCT